MGSIREAAVNVVCLILVGGGFALPVQAQIPAAVPLPAADQQPFRQEIRRVQRMLRTAGDPCTVQYALARTWAAGGQYQRAIAALQKAVRLKVGLDPSNDAIFAKLRGTREFQAILNQVRRDTPPVSQSRAGFTAGEPDLFPEGIAYDVAGRRFFLGSTFKHKILECTVAGECRDFTKPDVDGLGEVLGLKVDPADASLWAASNSEAESGLFHYDREGKLIRKYTVEGGGHLFNDLVVDAHGTVYVTDSRAGTVYWLSRSTSRLEVFIPSLRVTAANGIAISEPDEARLYVAGFPDGITVVDLAAKSFHAIRHPRSACLATIDGLYFLNGSLLAIQNGMMTHRVVRYHLNRAGEIITRFDVLERRNPQFDGGPTTGAIADGSFFYVANSQLDNLVDGHVQAGVELRPLQVLQIDLH